MCSAGMFAAMTTLNQKTLTETPLSFQVSLAANMLAAVPMKLTAIWVLIRSFFLHPCLDSAAATRASRPVSESLVRQFERGCQENRMALSHQHPRHIEASEAAQISFSPSQQGSSPRYQHHSWFLVIVV